MKLFNLIQFGVILGLLVGTYNDKMDLAKLKNNNKRLYEDLKYCADTYIDLSKNYRTLLNKCNK